MSDANVVLSSPRGRRLCGEVAANCHEAVRTPLFHASQKPADRDARRRLTEELEQIDPASVSALSEVTVTECLADAVSNARYWQEPDETDVVLAYDEVLSALTPIAQSLLAATATDWWRDGIDLPRQHYVQWLDEPATSPPRPAGDSLARWRATAAREEQEAAKLPRDADFSGTWWSTPSGFDLVHTSRSRRWLGAMQLLLTEDDLGWRQARVWPIEPMADARVFAITGPQTWATLVETYPLRVTRSRLHDWRRTTATDTEWFIPDWAAVADDYDGVHLSVYGYLTAPGTAIGLREGATVLAGWSPDTTFWLSDVLATGEEPVDWTFVETSGPRDEWHPVSVGR